MNRSFSCIALIVLMGGFCLTPVLCLADSFSTPEQDGIDQYNHEKYSKALKNFEAAKQQNPEDGGTLYNLASTHYRLGNFGDAIDAFEAAESKFKDPAMKKQALYNKGNALFRTGKVDKAIEAYQRALEIDPKDIDTKFNLEYARLQKEKAKQSGQTRPNNPDQKQKPNPDGLNPTPPEEQKGDNPPKENDPSAKNDSPPEPENKDDQEPESEKKETPSQHPTPSEEGDKEQQAARAMKEITSMNQEEADRWLNSLNEDLKKINRRQMQGQMKDLFVGDGKDW